LFLDEVSEITPHMQVKLLRALEDGEYIPVGSNTAQKADVRIIAATNRNFEDLIQQGLIREDIFYRIHVLAITVPLLRDRKEDIQLLVDHFLSHFGYDKTQHVLPGDVLEKLYTYHWPGNIRELQNVLRRYLTIGRLDFRSAHKTEPDKKDDGVEEEFSQESPKLREAVEDFEKRFIINTLKRHHWHKGKAAMALDIPRRTLHRKLKKFGIK
jgi:transcriptional regulator with PAS, ATPase and Fis domain